MEEISFHDENNLRRMSVSESVAKRAYPFNNSGTATKDLLENNLFMLSYRQVEHRGRLLVKLVEIWIGLMLGKRPSNASVKVRESTRPPDAHCRVSDVQSPGITFECVICACTSW